MSVDAAGRFLAVLAEIAGDAPPNLGTICEACAVALPVCGASLVLMGAGDHESVAGVFGGAAAAAQDAEFMLGEGPGLEAHLVGRPVVVADLMVAADRWPRFAPVAVELGIRAIHAVPLRAGTTTIGVLELYGDHRSGSPTDWLEDPLLLLANTIGLLLLNLQAEAAAESLAWALDIADTRAVVHQATGMISAQLHVGVDEALVRLRGRAFAVDRAVEAVAAEVVAGSSRFES